ncbi:MAG: indole-3-glycerol phosphate synthase TrpC [Spirosomaceae bacterium]|nr:indole-3-glycerol phosphate synthase TrpC [Spirosomataceae bacterium]
MNILDKITAHKRTEIATAKATTSFAELEKSPFFGQKGLSLKQRLTAEPLGIVAEFKRKSPSLGIINDQVRPEIVTRGYAEAGAAGLSVLTDNAFFGGDFGDFCRARMANPRTPMLRKDFMVDEYQLWEAKGIGADVILLIAACLTPQEVQQLAARAHELGMEVLLEVHDREELETCLCPEIDMVGVNNRNLKTFETSIETSLELASLIPGEFLKISESGLKDVQTIRTLQDVGYKGFLIGETFMKTPDPAQALKELINHTA